MNSVSLVIADRDEVFLNKVSKGILDRKLGYQVAIFTEMEPLLAYIEDEEVGILIIDSALFNTEILKKLKAKVKILMIEQNNISAPGFYKVKKFQKPSNFIDTINNIYINHDKYIEDRQKVSNTELNEPKKPIVDNSIEDLKIINEEELSVENNNSVSEDSLYVEPTEIKYSNIDFADEIDDLRILEDNMDEVLKRVSMNYVDESDLETNAEKVNWVDIGDAKNKSALPLNLEDVDIFKEIDRRKKTEVKEQAVKQDENIKNDFLDDFEIWSMQEKERMEKESQLELSKKEFDNSHSFDINNNNNNLNVGEGFNSEIFAKKTQVDNQDDSKLDDSKLDDYEDWANEQREQQELKFKLENMQKKPGADFFEKENEELSFENLSFEEDEELSFEKENEELVFENPSFEEQWENNYEPENVEFEMESNNSDNTVEIPINNFEAEYDFEEEEEIEFETKYKFEEEPIAEYEFEEEPTFEVLDNKLDFEPAINNEEIDFKYEEEESDLTFEEPEFLFEEAQEDLTFEEITNDFLEYEKESSNNLETNDYEEDNNINLIENEAINIEDNYPVDSDEKATSEDFKKWLATEDDIFEEYRTEIDQDLKRKSLEYLDKIEEDYEEWDFESKKWENEFVPKTIEETEVFTTKEKYDQEDFERWSIKQKSKDPDKFGGTFVSSATISFDDDDVFEMPQEEPETIFPAREEALDYNDTDFGMELAGVGLNNELFESPVAEVETKPYENTSATSKNIQYKEWKKSEEKKNLEIEKTISKTIGFYSPAGGNGTTTVALTFATMMAREGNNVFYLNLEKYNGTSVYLGKKKNIVASDFEFILNQNTLDDLEKVSILTDVDEKTNISFLPVDFIEGQMDENVFMFLDLLKKSNSHNYIIIDMDTNSKIETNILEQVDAEIIIISEGIVSIKKAEKYLLNKKSDYKIILNMKNGSAMINDNLDLICEIPYMASIKDEKDLLKITNQFIIYIKAIKSVLEK